MAKRGGMKPVYVGDVGEVFDIGRRQLTPPPKGMDFSRMSLRNLVSVALECGFDIRDLIGVPSCDKHYKWVFLGGKEMPQGMNMAEHVVYCQNCWQFFRMRNLP